MNQTKKYLLFGCMAAVLVTADSFPAFAGDSELYGVSLDQEEQAKAPVALDITAVYGKTARLGSFVPLKIRLYGQSESAFQGTLTGRGFACGDKEHGALRPAGAEKRQDLSDIKRREKQDHGGNLHGF